MITFKNKSNSEPFIKLRELYKDALTANQNFIEAISISSFNQMTQEVNSRLVNLKFIDNEELVFFSNYNSPKSEEFQSHEQISAIIFWSSIGIQIRFKGKIKRKSRDYNLQYFRTRSKEKNALAISSNQSKEISSYDEVIKNYQKAKLSKDLSNCPVYWGGFAFKPYQIEFWKGSEFRLNERNCFKKNRSTWNHFILEP